MKTIHVASWSGGKDSTFMIDEILRKNMPLDEIIFCDTGYEFKIMYEYINMVEAYWKSKYPNLIITKLNYGVGKDIWKTWAEGDFTKGSKIGSKRGFPDHLGMSWCTRELKINPSQKHVKAKYKHMNVKFYVGIAVDEPSRVREGNELYPMVDWNITEKQAAEILLERGLHNPLYNTFHRTGCFLCPKQSLTSLYKLWKVYPEEWQTIVDMQKRYAELNCAFSLFKGKTIEELIEKFEKYEKEGKSITYLEEEQPIGCMCK